MFAGKEEDMLGGLALPEYSQQAHSNVCEHRTYKGMKIMFSAPYSRFLNN